MSYEEMMIELRKEYLETFNEKIHRISSHLAKGLIDEIELEFHKMKGTGSTYGLPEISNIGQLMENMCREKPQSLQKALPKAIEFMQVAVNAHQQDQDIPEKKLQHILTDIEKS